MNAITEQECKELAEMLGICWHEKDLLVSLAPFRFRCKHCQEIVGWQDARPNFLDPVYVLEQAVKMEDWMQFRHWLYDQQSFSDGMEAMSRLMLDKTGLLAKRLHDWM